MSDAIRTESLGKTYPSGTVAVENVNLEVRSGEIFGFLGASGAGKTTTISILTTVLQPTVGYAEIEGVDVTRHPEQIRRTIGLVFQRSTADETLTGRENPDHRERKGTARCSTADLHAGFQLDVGHEIVVERGSAAVGCARLHMLSLRPPDPS